MDNNVHIECPRCSRPLQRFNGHIGYCSLHKWVSPAGLGFEVEAAEQNRLDAVAAESLRLEQERLKEEAEAQERKEEHAHTVRRVIAVIIALFLIAAGVTYYVVRPSLNYNAAAEKFAAGDYDAAKEGYSALGEYKDSTLRVILCEAMTDLNAGDFSAAEDKLDRIIASGQPEVAGQLKQTLSSIAANWKTNSLAPQELLMLVDIIKQISPDAEADVDALAIEGHTALLDDSVLESFTDDVDSDGKAELVALNDDYTVSVFHMAKTDNVRLPMTDEQLSGLGIQFGKVLEETDICGAVACYTRAHQLFPDEESVSSLAYAIHTAVLTWEERQIPASEVPAFIYTAGKYGIDLSDTDWESSYRKAAILSAENTVQSDFVDWNQDGYPELLTLDTAGKLSLYAAGETWGVVSAVDTKLSNCRYSIPDETAPLILVISANQDGFVALTGSSAGLHILFEEHGIFAFRQDGANITFSRKMEGSLARSREYQYTATGTENRPECVGTDWQQNSYPQPLTAEEAALRYLEARTYEIPEEAELLVQGPHLADIFSLSTLEALPAPDIVSSIELNPYLTSDNLVLFEAGYLANHHPVRVWLSAEYGDSWKVTGAAETYGEVQDTEALDTSVPLLSLNAETEDVISKRSNQITYRVLVPSDGRLSLKWQSGETELSRTAYVVSLLCGSISGEQLFTYSLQPSPKIQQSRDIFVTSGVYYVTVEAKDDGASKYRLTLIWSEESNIELESNDTSAKATPVEINNPYSASLSSANDVDFFSFELNEASMVNVTLNTSGSGTKSTLYAYAVYSAADGTKLASTSVPGNAQLSETGNLYLAAGSYFVQVAKGSNSTNEEYVLTVNAGQSGFMEEEPNDTTESAVVIPVNEDVRGSFSREGDLDFFTFTLDSDAVVQPRFSFTPTNSAGKTYVLTVLDSNRHELLKTSIGGKESTKNIAPIALKADKYIVKIENPQFVRQDYTLHIACMTVGSSELEPNDSAGLATALDIGETKTGVLTSEADVDYYRIHFDSETAVTLGFSFAQSASSGTAFVLSIEQNGKNQWSANVKADSGRFEQQLRFPAGEYYLKVKPSTWLCAVYTIEMF